jgi:hypothetical protein
MHGSVWTQEQRCIAEHPANGSTQGRICSEEHWLSLLILLTSYANSAAKLLS